MKFTFDPLEPPAATRKSFLRKKKIAYHKRGFLKQVFTVDELRALLKSLKLTAHPVGSTKSPSCKQMGAGRR